MLVSGLAEKKSKWRVGVHIVVWRARCARVALLQGRKVVLGFAEKGAKWKVGVHIVRWEMVCARVAYCWKQGLYQDSQR